MSAEADPLPPDRLAGWGHHPVVERPVQRPANLAALTRLVRDTPSIGPRGLGRSYGDASLPEATGVALDSSWLNRWCSFDADSGILRAEAGVSLREIVEGCLPRGWFLPVSPGTQQVTLGGAVASDIHGKNHHRDGSLADHVRSLTLITADGRVRHCSRDRERELFWATVGGMGLTGVIVDVELALRPVESAWIRQRTIRCASFRQLLEAFDKHADATYSVAWLDVSGGSRVGRGVLLLGEHATASECGRRDRYALDRRRRLSVPLRPRLNLLSSFNVGLFNRLYYSTHGSGESLAHYGSFFYPLDRIGGWNRLYGSRGFLQYQFVVPTDGGPRLMERVFDQIRLYGRSSFLTVLKRMGPPSAAPLSFSVDGWTLALDFPRRPELFDLLDRLDRLIVEAGGRVYLTKDARLSAETFRQMYPRYSEWLVTKRLADPGAKFRSEQSARLGIDEDVLQAHA